jgi:hypothetical protein
MSSPPPACLLDIAVLSSPPPACLLDMSPGQSVHHPPHHEQSCPLPHLPVSWTCHQVSQYTILHTTSSPVLSPTCLCPGHVTRSVSTPSSTPGAVLSSPPPTCLLDMSLGQSLQYTILHSKFSNSTCQGTFLTANLYHFFHQGKRTVLLGSIATFSTPGRELVNIFIYL